MAVIRTAQQIIDIIRQQFGSGWVESAADVFTAGDPGIVVKGIATSYTPSIEVLKRAVAEGKNLIITQQPAFYQQAEEYGRMDPAFMYKKQFITEHQLVVWRCYDNWNAREEDGQLKGLAKALGWEGYHIRSDTGVEYAKNNHYFQLPPGTLKDKVAGITNRLHIPAIRVIGNPGTLIQKASLTNGMFSLAELQQIVAVDDISLVVIAEAIEWESCEYFRDLLTWKGHNKAMVLIGREASEDPGYGELAAWLQTFLTNVPVSWIPAGEPFWVP